MIEKEERNSFKITCEGCGYEEVIEGSWKFVISEMKLLGWVIENENGEYFHYCSKSCQRPLKKQNTIKFL